MTALAGDTQALVTFVAPSIDGGSPIIGYAVTSLPAGGIDGDSSTTKTSIALPTSSMAPLIRSRCAQLILWGRVILRRPLMK